MGEPWRRSRTAAREMKGGQRTDSTWGTASRDSFMARARARAWGRVVFIFQLPAMMGVLISGPVLVQLPGVGQGQGQDIQGGEAPQAPPGAGPLAKLLDAIGTAGWGEKKEWDGMPAM